MAIYRVPEHVGKIRVYLDGVDITRDCFEVDTGTGEASVYLRNAEGLHYTIPGIVRSLDGNIIRGKALAKKRLKGKVRIELIGSLGRTECGIAQ